MKTDLKKGGRYVRLMLTLNDTNFVLLFVVEEPVLWTRLHLVRFI